MQYPVAARSRITRYLIAACAAYVLCMNIVCMLLQPQLFSHPHWGISYFGSLARTSIPYYGGFAIVVACLAGITYELRRTRQAWRFLYRTLWAVTLLAFGTAVTSSMHGAFLWWSHIVISFALTVVPVPALVVALRRPGTKWYEYACMALLVTGVVTLNLSATWAGVLGLYAWAEMIIFIALLGSLGIAARRALD